MSALQDAAYFATDPRLAGPLQAAIVAAAVNIMAESAEITHHAQRVALAAAVLVEPGSYVQRFAWGVSSNPSVVSAWVSGNHDGAENDFAFVVASIWDAEAGVSQ